MLSTPPNAPVEVLSTRSRSAGSVSAPAVVGPDLASIPCPVPQQRQDALPQPRDDELAVHRLYPNVGKEHVEAAGHLQALPRDRPRLRRGVVVDDRSVQRALDAPAQVGRDVHRRGEQQPRLRRARLAGQPVQPGGVREDDVRAEGAEAPGRIGADDRDPGERPSSQGRQRRLVLDAVRQRADEGDPRPRRQGEVQPPHPEAQHRPHVNGVVVLLEDAHRLPGAPRAALYQQAPGRPRGKGRDLGEPIAQRVPIEPREVPEVVEGPEVGRREAEPAQDREIVG